MSKAFDTVNIHTLTKKLLDTQIPPILIKFIANYIKGRKAFTTYNNKTSTQQFKTGVPQGGVHQLSSTYTPLTFHLLHPTSTSLSMQMRKQTQTNRLHKQSYNHKEIAGHNKTSSISTQTAPSSPQTQQKHTAYTQHSVVIPTVKNPKILGLTFDPKLTYNSHIRRKARNTLKLIKAGGNKKKQLSQLTKPLPDLF